MNGIETTRRLIELKPAVKIVGLSLYEEADYLEDMIVAGARGYVSKTSDPTNVTNAIRAVAADKNYFGKPFSGRSSKPAKSHAAAEELSADELAVIKRLANGRTNAEIAAELQLNMGAVDTHRTAAMNKLNLRSRAELARVAAARQWLDT